MKPSYIRNGIIVICSFIILSACRHDNGTHLKFNRADIHREVRLTGDSDSPKCIINMSVLYADDVAGWPNGNKASVVNDVIMERLFDMKNLRMAQAVDSFANRYIQNYIRAMKPLYQNDRHDNTKHSWYEYRYNVRTEVNTEKKDIDVYIVDMDYYEGGAHGLNQTIVLNFNAETGKVMTLKDIFVPGYEKRLNDILFKELKEKTGTESIIELQDKGYLCATEMFAPDNFILKENSMVFIYNIYEIAPYSNGKTELDIPYSTIDDIMKKQ